MKKVLLIKSSSLLFEKLLNQFKAEGVEVHALVASPVHADELKEAGVSEIYYVEKEDGFKLKHLADYRRQMAGETFDEVIALYNNKTGKGYLNVDLYAFFTSARKRLAVNYDRETLPLSLGTITQKAATQLLGYLWMAINILLSLLIFVLIFLGMVIVEIGRWLLKASRKFS